jgi:DNA-binding NarL/FixJ family response regulator
MKVKLGLPNHDIAEQAGWSEETVKTYAQTSMGALDPSRPRPRPSVTQTRLDTAPGADLNQS